MKDQQWGAAFKNLDLVEVEYNKHLSLTATAFKICDRSLFHTCHPTKETCGCDPHHKSQSAGQKEFTGHRYIWKHNIRSFYCYAESGGN